MRRSTLAGLALVGAAFLYGSTFVVVKAAVAGYPPISLVAWRFLVAGVALSVLAVPRRTRLWRDALVAGSLLFAGYTLQTAGLTRTGASNSALITGLAVVFTPMLAAALARRAPDPWVLIGAMLSFVGVALLTVTDRLLLGTGDLLTLGCAVAFAGHIVALSRLAPRHPVIPFTAAQVLVVAGLAFPAAYLLEGLPLPIPAVIPAILGTALAVSGGAFLLQIWAQTVLGPSRTAVILALESAFALATAAVVLEERLGPAGWTGAALILLAIYMVVTRTEPIELVEAESITEAH